jgi:DNA-binding MarR family transcriptional regulator
MWGTSRRQDVSTSEALNTIYPALDVGAYALCSQFLDTAAVITGGLGGSVEQHGLSDGRFRVMLVLLQAGEDTLTPSDIAERAGVTRATVTGLLDGLERTGLILRQSHRSDRRRILVTLTTAGMERMCAAVPNYFSGVQKVMSCLQPAERDALFLLMDKLRQAAVHA